ncbi:MAG: phage terminase large subunit [Usitatibacter sp.]
MEQQLTTNPFQHRALLVPEAADLFLGGGRGGGKSYALALLALRHVEQYDARARVLIIRKTYKGLADLELLTRELFGMVYGTAARYNAAEHIWRLPNGAYIELGQLETEADYTKYQGRSFTLLMVDEAGQFSEPDLLDRLRSNLRGPRDMAIRMVIAANPGGPGHHWLARRYVFKGAPWRAFLEPTSKRDWVYAPSTFEENAFIDRDQYRAQLESSCPHDPELLRAWILGDWTVARGAYFASVLSESRNAIDAWPSIPKYHGDPWTTFLAHDFGSSAPSVTYIVAQSPGAEAFGRYYPRRSLVLVDELATNKRDRLNEGVGWTVPVLSEEIVAMAKRWKVRAEGCADDAIFARAGHAAGSIAEEFQRARVYFHPARKADRITGWTKMRTLLADAGKSDVPGLYVARSCAYFWATVPYLERDARRTEDVDSSGPDHGADAARYACLYNVERMRFMKISGI